MIFLGKFNFERILEFHFLLVLKLLKVFIIKITRIIFLLTINAFSTSPPSNISLSYMRLKIIIFNISFSQLIKLLSLFVDMTTLDLFFIDWERPKTFNASEHFLHGSNKSHPGTPSIASSFKPTLSPSPTNIDNCVSAWRNYFIANEWQELITKRKISISLHIVFMIGTWLVSFIDLIK